MGAGGRKQEANKREKLKVEKMLSVHGSLVDLARTAQFFAKSAQRAAPVTSLIAKV
jgi:hypothetical protein